MGVEHALRAVAEHGNLNSHHTIWVEEAMDWILDAKTRLAAADRLAEAAREVDAFDWGLIATECPLREGDAAHQAVSDLCEALADYEAERKGEEGGR